MLTRDAVLEALDGVRDPELDESLTALGFVASVAIDHDRVAVTLRLPTYYCAPNFTYLMVVDARAALLAVTGVKHATVTVADHFSAGEINGAVAGGGGFSAAFPGETDGSLDELRTLFRRKALTARQSRVCDRLSRSGTSHDQLAHMRLDELGDDPDACRIVALRRDLGLDAAPGSPAFVRPSGDPLSAADLPRWLRTARLVRLSLEGNGGLCRGLLATRYGLPDPEEVAA
jgi:metal-sulfur cluster biosynthetic enzyme